MNKSLYRMEKFYKKTESGISSTMNVSSQYTRSWDATPGHVKKLFIRTLSSRNFEQPRSRYSLVQRERVRRQKIQQRQFNGPDPTLPHLKYGIFRQKTKRDPSRLRSPKAKQCKRSTVPSDCTLDVRRNRRRSSNRVIQEPISYVVRCTGAQYRQLSVSPSTHVDIRPVRATATVHVANSFNLPAKRKLSGHDGRMFRRYDTRNQNEVPKRRSSSVIFAKKLAQKY